MIDEDTVVNPGVPLVPKIGDFAVPAKKLLSKDYML